MPNPSTLAMDEESCSVVVTQTYTVPHVDGELDRYVQTLQELSNQDRDIIQGFATTIQKLAIDLKTATESRDRVLAANCDMTQKIRDLAALARASERFWAAQHAFWTEDINYVASDAQTLEVAETEGELLQLLEQHKALYTL